MPETKANPWAQLRLTFDDRDSRKPTGKLKFVEKVWGHEQWLQDDGGASTGYCGKILTLFKGYRGSLHYHPQKHETMYVNEGILELEILEPPPGKPATPTQAFKYFTLKPGDKIEIPPGVAHRMTCASVDIPYVEIFEVSTPHSDDDVVRLEPSGVEVF